MTRSTEAAYSPIVSVPTILNVTGTAAGVAITDSAGAAGVGGALRRVRVANVGTAVAGIVWALRTNASPTKITGQTIANATKIGAGAAETFLVGAGMSIGYVGLAADLNITISEA